MSSAVMPPSTISPVTRIRIFVDFWNFQISLNHVHAAPKVDWAQLGPWLATEAGTVLGLGASPQYEGMHVYLSYGANDAKLRHWATTVLDRFPGVVVNGKNRKAKAAPKCASCSTVIHSCPNCSAALRGTVEKGVDTAIVTDIVSMAWQGTFDVAVILSSDADFIPAVEFLDRKNLKTINAHFPPDGMELARKCWGSIDLRTRKPPTR